MDGRCGFWGFFGGLPVLSSMVTVSLVHFMRNLPRDYVSRAREGVAFGGSSFSMLRCLRLVRAGLPDELHVGGFACSCTTCQFVCSKSALECGRAAWLGSCFGLVVVFVASWSKLRASKLELFGDR